MMGGRMFRRQEGGLGPGLDVGALAPMVDMMTLLLVFLLRSYSTETAPSPPTGDFELAGTVSEESRQGGVELLVSSDAIYVEGDRVAALAYLGDDKLLRPVYDRLLLVRGKTRVEIHADRHVRWDLLQRVLFTAQAAGFTDLSLVAAHKGGL